MKPIIQRSANKCALCGGTRWRCYEKKRDGDLDPVRWDGWQPMIDYIGVQGVADRFWVDECVTCGAVVS